jgi:hypothetical protein
MLSEVTATAAFGPQIGKPSSTFSATLSTVRMEAKTWVQRVAVSVLDAEGAAAAVGVSAEGEGAAGGSLRPSKSKRRALFRGGWDMIGCDQNECTMIRGGSN